MNCLTLSALGKFVVLFVLIIEFQIRQYMLLT